MKKSMRFSIDGTVLTIGDPWLDGTDANIDVDDPSEAVIWSIRPTKEEMKSLRDLIDEWLKEVEVEKSRKGGLGPYQVRMLKEHDELFDRWIRISSFIETSEFKSLPAAEQDLLYEQHLAMSMYLRILKQRIGRWAGKAVKKEKDDSQ